MPSTLMDRRRFLGLVAATAAMPLVGCGSRKAPVLGFVHPQSPGSTSGRMPFFHQGLAEFGFEEGRNLSIEYRWADGHNEDIPRLVRELVDRNVSIVVAIANEATRAALAATTTIPIVGFFGGDAVRQGFARSHAHPGGNFTGIEVFVDGSRAGKRLQLLHEMVPQASRIGVLVNPTALTAETDFEELATAAAVLGVELVRFPEITPAGVDAAFAAMEADGISTALMMIDPTFDDILRETIVQAAVRHRVATQDAGREAVELGGLMSYTPNMPAGYRRTGAYAGRVLAGTNPADLPIDRATDFELVINLRRAAELGISVPVSFLATADELIE